MLQFCGRCGTALPLVCSACGHQPAAVRAGLAILNVVRLKPAPDVTLQARIGIASGVVVVGDLVREGVTQENAAIGETTNLAARLQSVARAEAYALHAALVAAGEPHLGVVPFICFEWHQRPENVLSGHIA
jgi:class 3 adenylate cyclase